MTDLPTGSSSSSAHRLPPYVCSEAGRSAVLAAYDTEFPLATGWRDRVALHQIFPLLVHAVLFGGAYGAATGSTARRALGV